MSLKSDFRSIAEAHAQAVRLSFDAERVKLLEKITDLIVSALKGGKKILLCGNGGSAADCAHIAAEFVGRFKKERRAYPAIALTTDTSALTAIGNDYGFDVVFSRQVEALGGAGDILIAITTSGNSPNILKACEKAREMKIVTVGFTGKDGGKLKSAVDHCFISASNDTPHIQEVHATALHAICQIAEEKLVS